MTRVLLIKVYRPEELWVGAAPLGLLAVAAYLREQAARRHQDLTVRILDLNPGRLLPDQALPDIQDFQPDVIGLSALSCEADAVHALSALLKQHLPQVPLILGGPYPSHDKEQALKDPRLDFLVVGEGEVTFDELVQCLVQGGDPSQVAGLALRRDGAVVETAERPFVADLDALPVPAYDLIDVPSYFRMPRHSRVYSHREYMSIVSTRGCPYRCIYCHVTMGKKTRFRSAEQVVDEIELLVKDHGIREIHWSDDIWNLKKARAKRICELILERGIQVAMAFPNGVRGDLMDDELLDLMRAAGTYHISFAPESGSPRVQEFIQKHAKLDLLKEVIAGAARRGIWCHGFFMVGFPTETREELEMTFRYARESRLNTASFFIVNAHKGTRLHQVAQEMGLDVEYRSAAHNYMNADFQLSEVPTAELQRMVRNTYLRFFLSPRRLWQNYRTVPHRGQLLEFARELIHRVIRHRSHTPEIYQAEGVPAFSEPGSLKVAPHFNRL